MARFCDKVTYNFSIKANVKALFAGEDGLSKPQKGLGDPSFTLNTNENFQTDSLIFFL